MMNQSTNTNNPVPQSGFPANFLKIFAALTMLIDHAAITLVYAKMAAYPEYVTLVFSGETIAEEVAATIPAEFLSLYSMYRVMRLVGRIAFPIFAFLLFEGFMHTSNHKRYLLRVGLCALLAEIPFNLIVTTAAPVYRLTGVETSLLYPNYQNTVFTLFLALLMLCAMKWLEPSEDLPKTAFVRWLGQLACVLAACVISVVARLDYSYICILFVTVLYFFRYNKKMQIIFGCLIFLVTNTDIAALLAFVPIAMYNGYIIRSKKFKYFFYIFYPAHLLVLYLISLVM